MAWWLPAVATRQGAKRVSNRSAMVRGKLIDRNGKIEHVIERMCTFFCVSWNARVQSNRMALANYGHIIIEAPVTIAVLLLHSY